MFDVEVIVYDSPCCPFTQRVLLGLQALRITYKVETIPKEKPEWFLKVNPSGETPVIKHKDTYVADSVVILAYLANNLAKSESDKELLYPAGSEENINTITKFIEEEWRPAFSRVIMASAPPMQKEWRPKLWAAFDKLEAELTNYGPFFLGKRYSALDIIISPFAARIPFLKYFRDISLPAEKYPKALDYFQTLTNDDRFQKVAIKYFELLANYKEKIPRLPALSLNIMQHQAFRFRINDLVERSKKLSNLSGIRLERKLAKFAHRWNLFYRFMEYHSQYEENVLFPVAEKLKEHSTKNSHEQHESLALHDLDKKLRSIKSNPKELHAEMEKYKLKIEEHLNTEETEIASVIANIPQTDVLPLARQVFNFLSDLKQIRLTSWVIESLGHPEMEHYIFSLAVIVNDKNRWKNILKGIKQRVSKATWNVLVARIPEVIPFALL